jgi:pimeloyl-ACP methyl ester carboxylesterase
VIERGFVTLPDRQRQVHYRRAGSGAPVVLVHASPGSSAQLERLIEAVAQRGRSVIAPDTAGFGESDSLPNGERPAAADYAHVVGAALDALGLEQIDLYGTHTGARIALELALARPRSVRSLLLDGIAVYTPAEQARHLAQYTPSIAPTWDGTHLLRAWNLRRDMALFWPWYDQTPAGRRSVGVPSPEILHAQVVDMLRGGDHYRGGYYAAFSHDVSAALQRVRLPTRLVFRATDIITDHASRLPTLPPNVHVEVLGESSSELDDIAERLVNSGAALPDPPPPPLQSALQPPFLTRSYVRTTAGQVHVRRAGSSARRPILLLHGSPRSGASLAALATALAADRIVLAVDTPGYGDSDKPTWVEPDRALEPFADVLAEVITSSRLGPVDVLGTHTGAALALELARLRPDLVGSLILHGLPLFDDAERADLLAHYFPSMDPIWDGAHLLRAWHMCRNLLLFWPWYRQEAGATLRYPLVPEALHRDVLDLLKAGPSYAWAYRAAFNYRTEQVLPSIGARALLAITPGDPLASHVERARGLRPDLPTVDVASPSAADQQAAVLIYREFLDG